MRRLYEECLEGAESVWQCVAIVWRVCVWRVFEESVESVCVESVCGESVEKRVEKCVWQLGRSAAKPWFVFRKGPMGLVA